ncbi:hypothetical protein RJ640_014603, partial [Escallonia rubra]
KPAQTERQSNATMSTGFSFSTNPSPSSSSAAAASSPFSFSSNPSSSPSLFSSTTFPLFPNANPIPSTSSSTNPLFGFGYTPSSGHSFGFSSSAAASTTPLFGTPVSSSPFGATSNSTLFGSSSASSASTTTAPPLFGSGFASSSSPFGSSYATSAPVTTTPALFGSNAASSSPFGSSFASLASTTSAPTSFGSIFASNSGTNSSPFGSTSPLIAGSSSSSASTTPSSPNLFGSAPSASSSSASAAPSSALSWTSSFSASSGPSFSFPSASSASSAPSTPFPASSASAYSVASGSSASFASSMSFPASSASSGLSFSFPSASSASVASSTSFPASSTPAFSLAGSAFSRGGASSAPTVVSASVPMSSSSGSSFSFGTGAASSSQASFGFGNVASTAASSTGSAVSSTKPAAVSFGTVSSPLFSTVTSTTSASTPASTAASASALGFTPFGVTSGATPSLTATGTIAASSAASASFSSFLAPSTAASSGPSSSSTGFSLSTIAPAASSGTGASTTGLKLSISASQPQSAAATPLFGTPYSFGGNCSGCSASILRVRVDYEEEGGMDEQVNGRMQLEVNPTKLEAKEELEFAGQDHDTEREEVEFEKFGVQESVDCAVVPTTSFFIDDAATIAGVTLPGKEIEGNKNDMPENVYAVSGVLCRDGIAYPGVAGHTSPVPSLATGMTAFTLSPHNNLIIKQILAKYGDITNGSLLKSTAARSTFLQLVAGVVHRLCNHTVDTLGYGELQLIQTWTADAVAVGFHVDWLQQRVDKVVAASKYHIRMTELEELGQQIDAAKKSLMEMELRQMVWKKEVVAFKVEFEGNDLFGANLVNNLPLAPQQAPSGDLMVFFVPYRLTKARVFKEAGVPASTSTAATTSSSSAATQTSSSLVVASSSGATSTVSTAVASAPKLPSEITGKTVEERTMPNTFSDSRFIPTTLSSDIFLFVSFPPKIIKEWNSELQERTGKFRKQANAIAEWDKKILRNRDVLLRLESEVAKVVETQSSLERQLELIETHQQEVDKALQSMEEEAEQIYKDERRLLLDDEAASTRDAMYEQAEIIERELEQMTEQIKQIIQTLNANQAGEFEAIDGMTPLDVVVRILNNQLSSLMWIDEKAEEFSSRIQKLASQGSAADREMMGPKLWLS